MVKHCCFPKPKVTFTNVLFSPHHKDIQFTVREWKKADDIHVWEAEKLNFFLTQKDESIVKIDCSSNQRIDWDFQEPRKTT